jgi:hypothetical protein
MRNPKITPFIALRSAIHSCCIRPEDPNVRRSSSPVTIIIHGVNPIRKGDSILSRQCIEAVWCAPIYGGETKMSLDVHITPDLDDEEEVRDWIEDDEEEDA